MLPQVHLRRIARDNHTQFLTLFRLYLCSPPDSRQVIVEHIVYQLASNLELQEILFQEIQQSGPQGRTLVKKIKVLILEMHQSKADNQAWDAFFEGSAKSTCIANPMHSMTTSDRLFH